MSKPKFGVEMRCETCGAIPPRDETRSNENWSVYPPKCPTDGGLIKPNLIEEGATA